MAGSNVRQAPEDQLLLATKLYVPRARPTLLARPRLLARLQAGLACPLTLISAPTGSGKTALLTDWLSQRDRLRPESTEPEREPAVAWLSLDSGDDDLAQFLRYLVAACQTLLPSAGATVLSLLLGTGTPSLPALMTALINDLARLPGQSILVLDDYHVVSDVRIHDSVTFLITPLPPHLHLIITSRIDPPLPLARWRAHDMLTELRAADLRFTVEEATAFLTQAMKLPLSTADVQALEQRTEGWIAGLQFAALAMRDRADVQSFVHAFTGSHRFVLDFLVDEVLLRQPPHLQTFLLRTSILDRMCSSLCDVILLGDVPRSSAVSNSSNVTTGYSQPILEELEQANLFVVPLDDARQWYRYHHLFADVLRHRLASGAAPDEIRSLHARAAAWYEQRGYVDEAVRHALAGSDFATAARLIEQQAPVRLARGELATLQHWLTQLPEEVIQDRPFLGRARVFVLLLSGRLSAIEAPLAAIEQGLARAAGQTDLVVQDDPAVRVLAGEVAAIPAFFAMLREQTNEARELCRQPLAVLPPDHFLIGFVHYNQGATAWLDGDVRAAVQTLQQAQQELQAAGNIYMLQVTMAYLAQVRRLQGQLRDAIAIYQQALRHTPTLEGRLHAQGNGLLVGLGALHYERNELETAEDALTTGIELARQEGNALVLGGGLLVLAQVRQAQGAADAGRALLDEATNLLTQQGITWLWVSGSVAAYQARLRLLIGDLDAAATWAAAPPGVERPAYLAECDDLARACTLLAQGRAGDVQALLAARLPVAERAGRMGHVIEGTALLALAHHAQGRRADAVVLIERALRLAAPESYVRTFVDMGMTMQTLLRAVPPRD